MARHNPDKSQALDTSAEVREVPSDQDKIERQRLAKEKRDRVMAQMSNMQRAFIRQNSDLYLSTDIK